jgi:hypothetical protein
MDRMERRRLVAALHSLLLDARGPAALTELVAAVQLASPLAVKDSSAAVRRALVGGLHAIPLDGGRWVLLEHALEGAAFRCTPHAAEIQHGRLYIGSRLSPFLPLYPTPVTAIRLVDAAAGLDASAGIVDSPVCSVDLAGWYRRHGFSAGDSIIMSVSYANIPRFALSHEPRWRRDPAVASRTQVFADAALDLLMGWGREEAPLAVLVQGVLARRPDLLSAPPDDYRDLFARDGRFRLLEGGVVSPADYRRPIDYLDLFPRWGRGSFQALNPGYFTPLEPEYEHGLGHGQGGGAGVQDAERAEPAGHWLRLLSTEVVDLDLVARRATLRVHADSSAGAFRSDVELTLRGHAPLARSVVATLRRRFRLLVAGQAPAGHGRGAVLAVSIADEALAVRQLSGFLKPLGEAAETPADAATSHLLSQARLEFTGPPAS